KKAESEKAKADEEPEEQHVSPVRSGRGKGYMRSRDQEENAPIAFKKIDVPRKTRSLTVADNIVEEPVAVELAKSINIEEKRHQQHAIMTQLTSDHQINKDIDDTYAEWGQKLKATDSDATQDSSCSDTDEERDDETNDFDDSDMDLFDDEPNGDDDDAGFGVFMYNKSTEPLKSTYLSPTVTCSSLDYIQSLLNETHVHELTGIMSHLVYSDAHTISVVHNLEGNPKIISYKSGASEVPFGTHVDVQATNLVLQDIFPNEAAHHTSSPPARTTL
ncbi:hypothetical protein Tco_0849395, partial [Tanacetum coccineum]